MVVAAKNGQMVGKAIEEPLHLLHVAERVIDVHVRYATLDGRVVHEHYGVVFQNSKFVGQPIQLGIGGTALGGFQKKQGVLAERPFEIKLAADQQVFYAKGLGQDDRIVVVARYDGIRDFQKIEVRFYPLVNARIACIEAKIARQDQQVGRNFPDRF